MKESLWLSGKIFQLFMSIYNHKFLIINHANSAIANIIHCLSSGQTKTGYEMSFIYMRVIPHNHSVQEILNETLWLQETWHGCENLGTAYEFSTRSTAQGWIGYAGTHVPMFVHKLGLIKPRQT